MPENNRTPEEEAEHKRRIENLANIVYLSQSILSSGASKSVDFISSLAQKQKEAQRARKLRQIAPMAKAFPGKATGTFLFILGLVIMACTLGYGIVAYTLYRIKLTTIVLEIIVPFLLSCFLLYRGHQKEKYGEIFEKYKETFGERPYARIQSLARAANQPVSKTIKNLEYFQSLNLYPQGRFSHDDRYYALSRIGLEMVQKKERRDKELKAREAQKKKIEKEYPRVYAMNQEITSTLDTIQDLLQDEKGLAKSPLKDNLEKTEYLLGQIKEFTIQNPEQVPDIKAFLDYFLPTTTKLLATYSELENQKIQTANVIESKEQIESALESINKAFENMYNDFYTGTAIDVYSDVSVLNTMIAQQGLVDRNFNNQGV